ncbi:isoleucine--tRNA ligase [Oecophyllibacter saccharovorans]|uniref:isoleucine--tRNA ligase n=1 Tax=Oecophyllibacter saccharovorans TaxID=2558360 RepID=UPI00116CCCC5|nr:isoleucine--tRNA ligase [Oecophyllibacter saccharovorans]TPW36294.1 isoleucine--tRNA ligase [Oecophyllibacter saccharovorans]
MSASPDSASSDTARTTSRTPDQAAGQKAEDRYRETVFLPKTAFPMRGGLPKREPEMLARWAEMDLDGKIRAQGRGREEVFTLHDGPPYANGHIHIGHALNKIMKDVVNRAQRMSGFEVRYMPGWDCHGLPIEWKVEEEYRKKGQDKDAVPVLQFRNECREYAARWVAAQAEDFKRIGVQAEWANRYVTMDYASEAKIAEEIGKFLLNGRLYRGLRPVMWSPVEKTALAEAEIEYHDITSPTVHIAFPNVKDSTGGKLEGASAVIWTTTPWTLPVNRALAAGPDIAYSVIEVTETAPESLVPVGARLIVADERLEAFAQETGVKAWDVRHRLQGSELEGSVFAHPLRGHGYDHDVPMLMGEFVTTEAGTGLVHMAPSHGQDDFTLCVAHGIEVPELVQDNGTYAPWVPELAGVHVFKAADPVCALMTRAREEGVEKGQAAGLMARGEILHSYPHSWRSRKPIIFRATPQWFISMDEPAHDGSVLRPDALRALENVSFVPASARRRLTSMVAQRPDWCISRQRSWGVPIAVFVEKRSGEVLRDPAVMERIVTAFREHGADAWYSTDAAHFLGPDRDPADYEQVFDIVDVWFESGCSHRFVLHQEGVNFPADLYLEGSDQHRGWFQSSLLESVGAEGKAPYKAVVTNGFVLDGQGRKMSKSLGNVILPADVIKSLGADVLRLWVLNSDTNEDLRISQEILKQQGELYRRLRNTLRWLLGGLDGFSDAEKVAYEDLPELEKYILHRLSALHERIAEAVRTHQWNGVYPALHAFCNNDLSAFYFDIRKDAVYCDAPDSHRRRSVRTVLDILHRALSTWLAPALVFTAEEAWQARFGQQESVHLQDFFSPGPDWADPALASRWDLLRQTRRRVTTALEGARRDGLIRASLEAKVTLPLTEAEAKAGQGVDWAELCIASQVETRPAAPSAVQEEEGMEEVGVAQAKGEKCLRCWRVLEEVGRDHHHPELCLRCVEVVEGMEEQ